MLPHRTGSEGGRSEAHAVSPAPRQLARRGRNVRGTNVQARLGRRGGPGHGLELGAGAACTAPGLPKAAARAEDDATRREASPLHTPLARTPRPAGAAATIQRPRSVPSLPPSLLSRLPSQTSSSRSSPSWGGVWRWALSEPAWGRAPLANRPGAASFLLPGRWDGIELGSFGEGEEVLHLFDPFPLGSGFGTDAAPRSGITRRLPHLQKAGLRNKRRVTLSPAVKGRLGGRGAAGIFHSVPEWGLLNPAPPVLRGFRASLGFSGMGPRWRTTAPASAKSEINEQMCPRKRCAVSLGSCASAGSLGGLDLTLLS
ncbi:uncharacterized protein ACOB8E_012622 [Sarcophilus harrisii]